MLVAGSSFSVSPWEGMFYMLVTAAAWGVGVLVRKVQQRSRALQVLAAELAAQQEAVAASAVVAERSRIAHEVHDSVAHSVSVMVLQMGGLRRLLPDKPEAQEVLLGLERLGREAVVGEAPGRGHPPRGGGRGGRCRPGAAALAVTAVRVVQEALSNVVRHAGATATRVQLAYEAERVTVTVVDDGRPRVPSGGASGVSGGHGQLHMRERVAVAGGSLEVGPLRGGGYRVRASFPVPAATPAAVGA